METYLTYRRNGKAFEADGSDNQEVGVNPRNTVSENQEGDSISVIRN